MNLQESYLDLVVKTVRGFSPIPEYAQLDVDRTNLAKEHVKKLRSDFKGKQSGNIMVDMAISMGSSMLTKTWKKLNPVALTMCGDESINQLKEALATIYREDIPGDFIEAGVWRGGLPVIMKSYAHTQNDLNRKIYIADSFQGLPQDCSDPKDKAANLLLTPIQNLSTSRELIENALEYFNLMDDNIIFLEGWFKDTLHKIEADQFSLVRLDGDYYESTHDSIVELYPKLSVGGYLIVDDYNLPLGCKRAINEYRKKHHITEEIIKINKQAVYWRKEREL
jgi:O-methyltransferase